MNKLDIPKNCNFFFFVYLCLYTVSLQAANHPLTKVNPTNLDLVISLDWDLNNPPTVAGTILNKTYIETTIRSFAQATFSMSEGRHKLGKIYIYDKSQNINRADMRFFHRVGRASATPGGLFHPQGNMQLYTLDAVDVLDAAIGKTMAHELAHYAYEIYDEYSEAGRLTSNDPGSPLQGDTPRLTIMNDHTQFSRFSIAMDYADINQRRTAQFRVFQSSAWETLVRNPNQDQRPVSYQAFASRRQLDVFKGILTPTALTGPTTGWENDLQILYQSENNAPAAKRSPYAATFVINTGLTAQQVASAKAAAKRIINEHALTNDRIAVLAYSDQQAGSDIEQALTTITDTNSKNQLLGVIDSINATQANNNDLSAALQQALTFYNAPVQGQSPVVVLVSDNPNSTPDVSGFKAAGIPIFVFAIGSNQFIAKSRPQARSNGSLGNVDGGSINILSNVASQTGGQYFPVENSEVLTKLFTDVLNEAAGVNFQILNDEEKNLTANQSFSLLTQINSGDSEIEFFASWSVPDEDLEFLLEMPDGTLVSPQTLPDGIEYETDTEDGESYAVFHVAAPAHGAWISTVNYTGSEAQALVFQEVSAESLLSARMAFIGGTDEDPGPIGLNVTVAAAEPVINAQVVADIFDFEGNLVAGDIELRDDGEDVDTRADDGVYSVVLEGALLNAQEAGDYEVCVTVKNDEGGPALFSTRGSLKPSGTKIKKAKKTIFSSAKRIGVKGANVPEQPVPPFQRFIFDYISLDTAPSPPSNTGIPTAIPVKADNTDEFGYLIENNAKLFYSFKVFNGNSYQIETNQLLSLESDGAPMVSNMQLLDGGGNVIFENMPCVIDGQSQNNSCIEGVSPVDATFYLGLSNVNPGFGLFALNVDQTGISTANSDRIFNWVEANFAQFVNPAGQPSMTLAGYYFRFYPGSNSYAATSEGRLLYLPDPAGKIIDLGPADAWLEQAIAAGF